MGRVRAPGVHGYSHAPDFAWSGWRYRIPGGPEGGQYHGFIAPDSSQSWSGGKGGWPGGRSEIAEGPQTRPSGHSLLPSEGSSFGPWDKAWGGTAFTEGQTHSDHGDHNVYRSPSEMRPRPNASGGVNVIFGHQDERTPGYAEAPGNYRSLGAAPASEAIIVGPMWRSPGYYRPLPSQVPQWRRIGPAYRIPETTIPTGGSGATNVVAQPPPVWEPGPGRVPAQNVVDVWSAPPISPAPAPTVAASPADYMPSQGQVIDGLTPGTRSAPAAPAGFTQWLSESTIFPSITNQWVLIGGVLAFLAFSGRGKR